MEENVQLINFTPKIVPFGAGYDDKGGNAPAFPSNCVPRKRKVAFEDVIREEK